MFKKILIANRGAIAVRIIRTLKRLNIASVAIYTTYDENSLHVELADEAVWVGEGSLQTSYLNAELILEKAQELGVDAIHPGYGFFSENADFARACFHRGIVFIGPTPEQIEQFGQKHQARQLAEQAEVPVVPGSLLLHSLDEAVQAAELLKYPVMLKATAGGGGIGMQVCHDVRSLTLAFETVQRTALSHFHQGGVFVEKYLPEARHIEVQIFGWADGTVVTLGERDCSLQRRNQKVVEESPAPGLSPQVRQNMADAARRLAKSVGYRNAGTVEFLYDVSSSQFYLLEVNTRLQVEHGITEEIYGIDLVEWMIREAWGDTQNFLVGNPKGHSFEVRLYAEDPGNQFRPGTGTIDAVEFPHEVRIETWIQPGVEISPYYDPMLAKIIVHGNSRDDAIDQMRRALKRTRIYGVVTNRSYLLRLFEQSLSSQKLSTRYLLHFDPPEHAIEVLDGGFQTTVQNWPGRIGYWQVGVPPSGPMDDVSFRLGNKLLGNDEGTAGLELTLRGGSYRFRDDIWFCVAGAPMHPSLDGVPVPLYQPVLAKRGQVLSFGETDVGMRSYLLVSGGFDIPRTLGSQATFTLGGFGGHGGRALQPGDIVAINPRSNAVSPHPADVSMPKPRLDHTWTIRVLPGPHCTPEFLQPAYLEQLTQSPWEVHYNSSRSGVRLIGPTPLWARSDGEDAGLHPSNIHDTPYAIGTLDLTGDMPILLGPDGPSLGGFVCPVTTITADQWKIGQLRPGDIVRFLLVTLDEAEDRFRQREEQAERPVAGRIRKRKSSTNTGIQDLARTPDYPIIARQMSNHQFPLTIRLDGDQCLLVEYGPMELDIRLRFRIHALMSALRDQPDLPVINLTPGIRSLQVHVDTRRMPLSKMTDLIGELDRALPALESIQVPSRIVRLPLSWDDPATQLATLRYQQNVRPNAPWCPDNLEFIRRINGLATIDEVKDIVYHATYLVLGLGDVYLGAPVAVPLDPRHRLITTKYNPARTWTPENAVGIGGAYLCIYGMEGPGGYQFVGRTIQMWNKWRTTQSFPPNHPWLLNFFDQIQFYPVSADELLELRKDFLRGRFEVDMVETSFDLGQYLRSLNQIQDSVKQFRRRQQEAFRAERERWQSLGLAEYMSETSPERPAQGESRKVEGFSVHSTMPGSVWKVLVEPGAAVDEGDGLIVLESMKMEVTVPAPYSGTISQILVKAGDQIRPGQLLMGIVEDVSKKA